jgi:EAL domain-containing protein (putative c-di-GMP-specific phosphodiesterase class I)
MVHSMPDSAARRLACARAAALVAAVLAGFATSEALNAVGVRVLGERHAAAATAAGAAAALVLALVLLVRLPRARTRRQERAAASREDAAIAALLREPGAIRPVFQPILDLRTGELTGYEALARFPDGGRPDLWFARAHRAGRGLELEAAALRAALAAAHDRPADSYVAVNLSPTALLADAVAQALPSDLHGVVIEVTENELVTGGGAVHAALSRLRARGARFAVDDAGAGYAGFQQLLRLRPDVIKLDRSLVEGIARDPVKRALVASFVAFSRRIGAEVCAEGIETLADLRAIADLDVALGQGFGIARPAPPWAAPDPAAAKLCRVALDAALGGGWNDVVGGLGDQRLEQLVGRLSQVDGGGDLDVALALLGRELDADQVHLSELSPDGRDLITVSSGRYEGERWPLARYPSTARLLAQGSAVQILASDPRADPAETEILRDCGGASMLMLAVRAGGRSVGLLELVAERERPWSRTTIERARIISYALGGFLGAREARARQAA